MTRHVSYLNRYGIRVVEAWRPRWWPHWDYFEGLVGWLVIAILVLAILVVGQ